MLFLILSVLGASCLPPPAYVISTPTPAVTILPAEVAVLNIKTEVTQDGSSLTTAELSISPIGKGDLEIVAPMEMLVGETRTVKVTITPENAVVGTATPNLTPTPHGAIAQIAATRQAQFVATQQALEMYPLMIAELKGLNFQVLPNIPSEKLVTTDSVVEWLWAISPSAAGEQVLLFTLSTPVVMGQNREIKSTLQITSLEIKIMVLPNDISGAVATDFPTATPVPTITLAPTLTPTATKIPTGERIQEKLIDNAGIIAVAIIGFLGVALTGYLQYIATKKADNKKTAKNKSVSKNKTG